MYLTMHTNACKGSFSFNVIGLANLEMGLPSELCLFHIYLPPDPRPLRILSFQFINCLNLKLGLGFHSLFLLKSIHGPDQEAQAR